MKLRSKNFGWRVINAIASITDEVARAYNESNPISANLLVLILWWVCGFIRYIGIDAKLRVAIPGTGFRQSLAE
ncbi:hypothetical protein [Methylotuvimicrobium buryatense]|uniref:hypothetical protein n=1 Tax=Methylotuvimicrobium buryatense TaxID=95641 RepID=UPI0003780D06|nr:hypothetical protein [Methylotuvimicrobium buryatense]